MPFLCRERVQAFLLGTDRAFLLGTDRAFLPGTARVFSAENSSSLFFQGQLEHFLLRNRSGRRCLATVQAMDGLVLSEHIDELPGGLGQGDVLLIGHHHLPGREAFLQI